ncbi:class I SAM-dependent methyltransferase [Streptomyces sp. NPDC050147]|uniref:class I SAM-dependent methyltransferase n=1 Tax=Streptomyces sp. NPDC050147 TaxID=3155513 RepID=UPI00342A245B
MLALTRARVPDARLMQALFPPLPFATGAFDRLVTANFYGLLRPAERALFLTEARRVARELLVIDLRSDSGTHQERHEVRTVEQDTYSIYRRRFTPQSLSTELDGEVIYGGRYFLVVQV